MAAYIRSAAWPSRGPTVCTQQQRTESTRWHIFFIFFPPFLEWFIRCLQKLPRLVCLISFIQIVSRSPVLADWARELQFQAAAKMDNFPSGQGRQETIDAKRSSTVAQIGLRHYVATPWPFAKLPRSWGTPYYTQLRLLVSPAAARESNAVKWVKVLILLVRLLSAVAPRAERDPWACEFMASHLDLTDVGTRQTILKEHTHTQTQEGRRNGKPRSRWAFLPGLITSVIIETREKTVGDCWGPSLPAILANG